MRCIEPLTLTGPQWTVLEPLEHRLSRNGTLRNTAVFSIIASEWPTVKAHLDYQLAKSRG